MCSVRGDSDGRWEGGEGEELCVCVCVCTCVCVLVTVSDPFFTLGDQISLLIQTVFEGLSRVEHETALALLVLR